MISLTPGATWLDEFADRTSEGLVVITPAMFVLLSTAPWTFLISSKVGQPKVWMPSIAAADEHVRRLFEGAKKIV